MGFVVQFEEIAHILVHYYYYWSKSKHGNRILSCTHACMHIHMHTHANTRGIRTADTRSVPSLSHYTSTIQCGVYILRTKNRKCSVTELEAMVRKNMTLFNSQASGVDVLSYCSGRSP